MSEEKIKELAHDLMFDVNDEQIKDIKNEFDTLDKMIEFFDSIDTSNVEEMIYPLDIETSFLREDKESNTFTQQEALSNVKKVKQGHILVPKVVK